jgi:hypothetical protein
MAVSATHFAFINLRFDTQPTAASSRVVRDVRNFLANVVELKHNDVSLPAIDARMLAEVVHDLLAHLAAPLVDLPSQPGLFTLLVRLVIPRVRFRETLATPRLELRLAPSHGRKRFERLRLAAFRARSHEGERADRSISRK